VKPVSWINPGEDEALKTLRFFVSNKLNEYKKQRNDPNEYGCSQLSPYLHFGQISAQRVAIEVLNSDIQPEAIVSFLEELIIRRELSDNYCYYNPKYDSFDGFPFWAQKTLNEHRLDEREFLYNIGDFENASTHEKLWNSAQNQLKDTGKMHGYLRMYWAKKILEWTSSPEEALKTAIYLNDKYSLDGRDPNGYVGCAWSIGGVHDRAWNQHPVYGKIRYMNESGCRRKFDVKKFISHFGG
jgi:deoxyribodipyrimidine photo-lyase